MSRFIRFFGILCIGCAILSAQEGRLSGTVTDSTGAVVPGVMITATQTTQNISFTAKSGPEGLYSFPRLPIGPYNIKAEFSGFKTFLQSGLSLTTNSDSLLNIV